MLTHSDKTIKFTSQEPKDQPTIVSSNWQHFHIFSCYKSVKLDVLCRQNKIWTFGNPF